MGFPAVTSAIVALAMLRTRSLVIPRAPFPQVGAADPETERPCAVPVEGSGVCLQRLSCKRLIDANVTHHNASSVEFKELEVRRPRLRPSNVFGGPFARSTKKLTFAPAWVTDTVPNGAVPQPPVQWSDVKSNMTALPAVGSARLGASKATAPSKRDVGF
jgi:hypothetical protein